MIERAKADPASAGSAILRDWFEDEEAKRLSTQVAKVLERGERHRGEVVLPNWKDLAPPL